MSYQVHTTIFEGPLDLLLQLITSRRLEITDLSLSGLVTEYLSHLDAMRDLDMEITSEFLLIAATLIQLKARYLLPEDVDIDLDEELALAEERDRLLARLLACLTFKDVAAVLLHRMDAALRFVPRLAGLDDDIRPAPPQLKIGVDAATLAAIADRVFTQRAVEPDLDHLDFDLASVDDAIGTIRDRINAELRLTFDELVAHCERPTDVIAYFLALLELSRWGLVKVDQIAAHHEITIEHNPEPPPGALEEFTPASEWTAT